MRISASLSLLGCCTWIVFAMHAAIQDPAPTPPVAQVPPLAATDRWLHGHFATGATCSMCHGGSENATAMRDAAGRSVAPHDLWSASMMANSARDPLWRAFVSAEVAAHPDRRAQIEAECMRCHTPMAAEQIRMHGGGTLAFPLLYGDSEDPLTQLALDGASCTTCHQMPAEALGDPKTYSGQFELGHDQIIYGPHAEPVTGPMMMHTKFTPTQGEHVMRSALCASCHTLFTTPHAENASKESHDESELKFPEQTPYLEWRNSVFDDEREQPSAEAQTCQGCHMPQHDADGQVIETRLAHNPGGRDFPFLEPRRPFGRHLLMGGNTLVPALLRDFADELRPGATTEAFDRVIAGTRQQLREKTARLAIEVAERNSSALHFQVVVENLVGHKFPSGIPVRRTWLRVRVRDAAGRIVFASGEHDAAGRLLDEHGQVLAIEGAGGPVEPHRKEITTSNEVALFEAVMQDQAGDLTWRLLEAAGYRKDNRLLPRGWDPKHPDAEATKPAGVDFGPQFHGGAAVIHYRVALPSDTAGYEVEAALLYQPLGARHLAELSAYETGEILNLRRYLRGTLATELVAETTQRVP